MSVDSKNESGFEVEAVDPKTGKRVVKRLGKEPVEVLAEPKPVIRSPRNAARGERGRGGSR